MLIKFSVCPPYKYSVLFPVTKVITKRSLILSEYHCSYMQFYASGYYRLMMHSKNYSYEFNLTVYADQECSTCLYSYMLIGRGMKDIAGRSCLVYVLKITK